MASSTSPKFQVFISHAGEDKATIAIPLRNILQQHGIKAFVDEKDMPPGSDAEHEMITAMQTADIGVIILSPEFVAKKWPMKELLCFLERRDEALKHDRSFPKVIPVFYRLTVSEIYNEPRLERTDAHGQSIYHAARFFERMNAREPEANIETIKQALRKLHGIVGVRNDVGATNDSDHLMSTRREILIKITCEEINRALGKPIGTSHPDNPQAQEDKFRCYFPPIDHVDAVLDFGSTGKDGKPETPEGRIKARVLDRNAESRRVISILGIGGVGKSIILKGLTCDEDIRNEFVDGVHVMSLGMDATRASLFRRICNILRHSGATKIADQIEDKNDTDGAISEAIAWFRGKKCAFLIDDAWAGNIGMAPLSELCKLADAGKHSAVILTTREHEIASLAPPTGISCVHPREPEGPESRNMLFCHAGMTLGSVGSGCVEESITEILRVCCGLPVSLAVAGKGIKIESIDMDIDCDNPWEEYLFSLRICREQLIKECVSDYGDLYATFRTAISLLEKRRDRIGRFQISLSFVRMYSRLCVLQKQEMVPASMLRHLWEMRSEDEAREVGMRFVRVGLGRREYHRVGSARVWHFCIHDSLHDFAVIEASRHGFPRREHDVLLNGYRRSNAELWSADEGRTKWWSTRLKADGYIHRNLCRHLREAEQLPELIELLKTPEWIARQLEVTDIIYVDADFALGIAVVLDPNYEGESEDATMFQHIRDALRLSCGFFSKNLQEFPFQLFGRLLRHKDCKPLREFLIRMEQRETQPWLQCVNQFLADSGSGTIGIIPVGVPVLCMAVVEKKRWVACGCDDGKVVVVNLIRATKEKEWRAHYGKVTAIASGKGGERIVTGSSDGQAKVWNVKSGTCVSMFHGHSWPVKSLAITAHGKLVASAAFLDCSVCLWDIDTGRRVTKYRSVGYVRNIVAFPRGRGIVCGESDGALRVWNESSNGRQYERVFEGYWGAPGCPQVCFTADGEQLVSWSGYDRVGIWRVATRERTDIHVIPIVFERENPLRIRPPADGDGDTVGRLAISDDDARIAFCCGGGEIQVRDMKSLQQIRATIDEHTADITDILFGASSDIVVSCSLDTHVRVCDLRRMSSKNSRTTLDFEVSDFVFTPNGERILFGSRDGSLRVWNTLLGQQLGKAFYVDTTEPWSFAVTPNGRHGVVLRSILCHHDNIRIWDLYSHHHVLDIRIGCEFRMSEENMNTLLWKLSRDLGCTAVDCSEIPPSFIRSEFCAARRALRADADATTLTGPRRRIGRIYSSEDGRQIMTVSWDCGFETVNPEIYVWDIVNRKCVEKLESFQLALKRPMRCIMDLDGVERASKRTEDGVLSVVGREIRYKKDEETRVLGTMEADIDMWKRSPDKKLLCAVLKNRQVAVMKLLIPGD